MKQKILPAIIALCLALILLPVTALAEDTGTKPVVLTYEENGQQQSSEYDDPVSALAAASGKENAVVTVRDDVTVSSTINAYQATKLVVEKDATLTCGSIFVSNYNVSGVTLENYGTIESNSYITGVNGNGVLHNASTGRITCARVSAITVNEGGTGWINDGTITLTGNSTQTTLTSFINNGTITATETTGTVKLVVKGTGVTGSGTQFPLGTYTWDNGSWNAADAIYVVRSGQTVAYADTFSDALNYAQDGDVLELQEDLTISSLVPVKSGITINLNQHKVILNGFSSSSSVGLQINSGEKEVTIRNGTITIAAEQTISKDGFSAVRVWNGILNAESLKIDTTATTGEAYGVSTNNGTFTLDANSSISSNVVGVLVEGASPVVDIYGVVDTTTGDRSDVAIQGNGTDNDLPGSTITIHEGAEVTAAGMGIYHPQAGTLNIEGGEITGETAIGIRSGTLNITGGTITGTAPYSEPDPSGGGISGAGSAIFIGAKNTNDGYYGNIEINISGGDTQVVSQQSYAVCEDEGGNSTALKELEITGGTIASGEGSGIQGDIKVTDEAQSAVSISGGTFSHTVDPDYCAPGLVPSGDTENGFTVVTDSDIFSSGTGTKADSFVISNAENLIAFRNKVNRGTDFAGQYIRLGAPIDLSSEDNWTPIGNGSRSSSSYSGNAFRGTFDGSGQTITGLTITSGSGDTAIGLFGVVAGGTVENVKLKDVSIAVSDNKLAGGVAGLLCEGGIIRNCEVLSGSISILDGAGGIVGRMVVSGTIEECINHAAVSASNGGAGGIVGKAYYTRLGQEMTISDCVNHGTVSSSNGGYIGGIAGLSAADTNNCQNTADITGNSTSIGGIVGEQQSAGSVTGCTNSGTITNHATNATAYGTGGIVGWARYNESTINYEIKEIIEVANNVNSGKIVGGNDGGGIIGTLYNAGVVTGNENMAETISGDTFAAGIVGNIQNNETPVGDIDKSNIQVTNNVSTTSIEAITGSCTDLYAYNNPQNESAIAVQGNSAAWVARIDSQKYATLQGAIDAASSGETITVLQNVELTTALNLSGKTNLALQGSGKDVTISTNGIAGQKVFAGAPSGAFTLKDLTFTDAIVTINNATGTVTVDGCTFKNTATTQSDKSGVLSVSGSGAGASLAVKSSTFQNLTRDISATGAEFVGIYTSGTFQSITIQNSQFKNIAGTALSLRGTGTMSITGNTFDNWANGSHNSEGRAVRVDFSNQADPTLTFTENKLLPGSQTKESYVKIGEISGSADPSLNVAKNYWGGKDPAVATVGEPPVQILEVEIDAETLNSEQLKAQVPGTTSYYKAESMNEEDLNTYVPPYYGGGSSSSSGDYIVSVDSGKNGSVSVSPSRADKGDTVTITVKPNTGYELDELTVTDKDGDAISVKYIGANKYTFTMPAGKVTVKATFVEQQEELPFVDVAANAYYYDAVAWAVENGVTSGITDTTFAPGNPCTRAQTVTFLWRAAGCPTPVATVNPFTDVKATDYYYNAVLWAVENGITSGTTATTFGPAATCTRAQVVTFLYRYSKDEASTLPMFADVAENDYYYGAVAWAVENGVTTGVTETAFQPGDPCTRGQIVTFLYRYMGE